MKSCSVQTDAIVESPFKNPGQPSQQVLGLLGDLKARLKELELDLDRLKQENELLQQEKAQAQLYPASTEDSENQSSNTRMKKLTHHEAKEHEELQSCLRDQMRQMGLLEARFHHLEERARAKAELYKQTVDQIDDLNEKLFDVQQQLVKQKQAIQKHEDHTFEVEVLRREAHLLRSENAKLNEAIATLSSRPFDELSVDLQKKNLWIGQLEETNKMLETQVSQAKKDFRVAQQTTSQLRERVKRLQQETQAQVEALEQAKLACEHSKMAQEIAELQLRFYTAPGDKALMCALGKALKDLRAQENAVSKLTSFMEKVDDTDSLSGEQPGGCVKCRTSSHPDPAGGKVSSLQKQRLEKVAELTQLMRADTEAQIASLKLIHAQQLQTLKRKVSKAERCASEYLDQIRELQREKGELLRQQSGKSRVRLDADSLAKNIPSPTLQASDELAGRDDKGKIAPDPMNIIEIVLSELRLTDVSTSEGHSRGSLVLLCDYFDFESQLSPVIPVPSSSGSQAAVVVALDFGITYKTCQDASFFQSPIARELHIELQQLIVGCVKLVGVAKLDLNALFLSPSGQCTMTLKLLGPFTGAVIGSIRIEQSLGHPVDAFYKSILRNSRNAIVPSVSALTTASKASASVKQQKGVVTIRVISLLLIKTFVSDLRTASSASNQSMRPNSQELSYRFVGFPRVKVPVEIPLAASKGGFFVATESFQSFEVEASADFLRFLHSYSLDLQLRLSPTAQLQSGDGLVNGHASVAIGDALRQQSAPDSPSTAVLFVSICDSNDKDRLLGRIALEISLCGFFDKVVPQFLPNTSSQVPQVLKKLFTRASPETGEIQANWQKFRDVMGFSPLEKSLRDLLYQKKPPTKTSLSNLVTKLDSTMASNTGSGVGLSSGEVFMSLERLGAFLTHGGIRLAAVDLAMLLSGLHHACRPSTGRVTQNDRQVRAQTSMLMKTFALLCETCDDQWLPLEASIRQRAHSLGSLNVQFPGDERCADGSPSSTVISWEAFQQRLGMQQLN